MPATLGEFLALTRRHLAAAAAFQGELAPAARREITVELDRLLAVMNRYAADARAAVRVDVESIAASLPAELMAASTSLVIARAAQHFSDAARAAGQPGPPYGHPVAAYLRAATDCLFAGRDVLGSHVPPPEAPGAAASPWLAVIRSPPVGAALMRELGRYCLQLAPVTARLAEPAAEPAAGGFPAAAREAAAGAAQWLVFAGSSLAAGGGREPGIEGGALLLHAIAVDAVPPRLPPAGQNTVPVLVAGITGTSARLSHLARLHAAGELLASSACCRHDALATSVIGHASELLLATLTERAAALKAPPGYRTGLRHAAGLMTRAWQSWRAVIRAWDPVTTGTSRKLHPLATELTDLVLHAGRLARTSPDWTPARSDASPLRDPAALAPTVPDRAARRAAIADAADATISIARADELTIASTAGRNALFTPARLLPENNDLARAYRYRPAAPGQVAALLGAYEQAITASLNAVAALDDLLIYTPPIPISSLARYIARNPATSASLRRLDQALLPDAGRTPKPAAPEPGALERLLRQGDLTDPALLLRAALLDHATQALTAEASAAARHRSEIRGELGLAEPGTPPGRSARAARQDQPATLRPAGQNLTPGTPPDRSGRKKTASASHKHPAGTQGVHPDGR